jgi:tRNA A37 threonylcarbamoyltransferase TsaD
MSQLTRMGDEDKPWYPFSISGLESILKKLLNSNNNYEHVYALRKNIAYNLQYLQFQDIKLSSVLYTQAIKSVVLVGCGIIESLLHFLLIANRYHTTTEW